MFVFVYVVFDAVFVVSAAPVIVAVGSGLVLLEWLFLLLFILFSL